MFGAVFRCKGATPMIGGDYQKEFAGSFVVTLYKLSLEKDDSGNYLSPVTQKHYADFRRSSELSTITESGILSESDKAMIMEYLSVKHSTTCHFEGDKCVVPAGQGRSVKLAVLMFVDGFKLQKGLLSI